MQGQAWHLRWLLEEKLGWFSKVVWCQVLAVVGTHILEFRRQTQACRLVKLCQTVLEQCG